MTGWDSVSTIDTLGNLRHSHRVRDWPVATVVGGAVECVATTFASKVGTVVSAVCSAATHAADTTALMRTTSGLAPQQYHLFHDYSVDAAAQLIIVQDKNIDSVIVVAGTTKFLPYPHFSRQTICMYVL